MAPIPTICGRECAAVTWIADLRSALQPSTTVESNELIAQFFRNQHEDQELIRRLRRLVTSSPSASSEIHDVLASLPVNVFITTNYDHLLETSLRARTRPLHVICDDVELTQWDEDAETQLIKLHGDIDRGNTIVITADDYAKFLHSNRQLQQKLCELLTYRTVVFVGYSMRDMDVTWVLDKLTLTFGSFRTTSYILTDENDVHILREWRRRGVRAIVMDGPVDESMSGRLLRYLHRLSDACSRRTGQVRRPLLVVDDDEPFRGMLGGVLRRTFESGVLLAADGLEACLAIGVYRPSLILLDLAMPQMNGWEFLRFLRARKEYADIPVVIVSGHLQVDPAALLQSGVAAVLPKPFDMPDLLDLIEHLAPNVKRRAAELPE
jgi:CheY-like chemotaxis protein